MRHLFLQGRRWQGEISIVSCTPDPRKQEKLLAQTWRLRWSPKLVASARRRSQPIQRVNWASVASTSCTCSCHGSISRGVEFMLRNSNWNPFKGHVPIDLVLLHFSHASERSRNCLNHDPEKSQSTLRAPSMRAQVHFPTVEKGKFKVSLNESESSLSLISLRKWVVVYVICSSTCVFG